MVKNPPQGEAVMRKSMAAIALVVVLVAGACGKDSPTGPQARPAARPAYDGGGYMGSGD